VVAAHPRPARANTVKYGRSVRPDLGEVLVDPRRARPPSPVAINRFAHELDEPKKRAVQAALGSEDLLVVRGPPGTGKTTFISELVLQELQRNPAARILIASQSHAALDHAVASIREENKQAIIDLDAEHDGVDVRRAQNLTTSTLIRDDTLALCTLFPLLAFRGRERPFRDERRLADLRARTRKCRCARSARRGAQPKGTISPPTGQAVQATSRTLTSRRIVQQRASVTAPSCRYEVGGQQACRQQVLRAEGQRGCPEAAAESDCSGGGSAVCAFASG
jgi:hypothetical protein